MGMGLGEIIGNALKGRPKKYGGGQYKCPNCDAMVTLDMERCQNCGVRIKSMFRKKCPRCGERNEIDAVKCQKCFFSFEAEEERIKKTYYVCPICGHKSEAFLTRCPACNTRFL